MQKVNETLIIILPSALSFCTISYFLIAQELPIYSICIKPVVETTSLPNIKLLSKYFFKRNKIKSNQKNHPAVFLLALTIDTFSQA